VLVVSRMRSPARLDGHAGRADRVGGEKDRTGMPRKVGIPDGRRRRRRLGLRSGYPVCGLALTLMDRSHNSPPRQYCHDSSGLVAWLGSTTSCTPPTSIRSPGTRLVWRSMTTPLTLVPLVERRSSMVTSSPRTRSKA